MDRWQHREDSLIQLIFDLMERGMPLGRACARAERLIEDHMAAGRGDADAATELSRLAPGLASPSDRHNATRRLHSAMPLSEAFQRYDARTRVSARQMVPPQFREVRNIVNIAQVLATAQAGPKLVTFDGDGTLYPDRCTLDFEEGPADGDQAAAGPRELVALLVGLLERGITVALCTAVGAPDPQPYEDRLRGLLRALRGKKLPEGTALYAVGGQCNYLFRYSGDSGGFTALRRETWESDRMKGWDSNHVGLALDAAEQALREGAESLGMKDDIKLIRKERAVGVLYNSDVRRSTAFFLDELALLARAAVKDALEERQLQLPFCTFNGGRDVFVDIGTKEIGIDVLRALAGAERAQTLHVGDQFTRTGNDLLARRACGTIWVDDPQETTVVLRQLLKAVDEC